ncbi:MAG: glycosyltransferase family A protein [Pseudomonadota bacterium]
MSTPLLSVIVIAYDMPRQALNTLISLSPAYQQAVNGDDYEVILVENRSGRNIDEDAIRRLPGNFRYFLRDEESVSPAAAINFGIGKAKGQFIGLMIDGARMITPGVIRYALMAFKLTPDAMALVPGYHLGEHEQQFHAEHGYDEDVEKRLLDEIDWQSNGYRLFDISCICGANPHGFFHPFMESNCFFVTKKVFEEIGGADERFNMPGGGALNLYLYYKIAMHHDTESYLLAGEGSFHQIHGGVTTSTKADRDDVLKRQGDQLDEILGHPFLSPRIELTLLGKIPTSALRYVLFSAKRGIDRAKRFAANGREYYEDDARKRGGGRAKSRLLDKQITFDQEVKP